MPNTTFHSKPVLRILLTALLAISAFQSLAQGTNWIPLFNGKELDGWITNDFAGAGEVRVEDGQVIIGTGIALTGIKKKEAPYTSNYEVMIEAMKIQGDDFFCGFTFPVKDAHATLIVGGWGGSLVGFSSVDGMDASENDTSKSLYFERNRWYHVRMRVQEDKILVWIDDQKVIDVETKGRKIATRPGDIDRGIPLGIATWQTSSALKNIKLRTIR